MAQEQGPNTRAVFAELRATCVLTRRLARHLVQAAALSLDMGSTAGVSASGLERTICVLAWQLGLTEGEMAHLHSATRFVVAELCRAVECVLLWEASVLYPAQRDERLYIVIQRMVEGIEWDIEPLDWGEEFAGWFEGLVERGRDAAGDSLPKLTREEIEREVLATPALVNWIQGAIVWTKTPLCFREAFC